MRVEGVGQDETMVPCLAALAGEVGLALERLGFSDEADFLEDVRRLRFTVLVAADAKPGE